MLSSCSEDSKLILLEILSALTLIKEVRKFLCNSRRVHHLVEAAGSGCLVSRTRAAQAIGLLGLIKRARHWLVNVGVIPVLMDLIKEGDPTAKLVAGNALGAGSSHVNYIRLLAQEGVIPLYAELLQGSDPIGKEIAEDVFCVLAFYEENAIEIAEHLVRTLRGENFGAKAAAADVIGDLSTNKYSVPLLQNSGDIPILVELLKDDNMLLKDDNMDVKEKVAGAVAQLSQNETDRAALANSGAIPLLLNMLEDESDELRDNAAEALMNFSMDLLLGDQISCILENPSFQSMHDRVMQMLASDEHLDMSLRRQISTEPLTWDPGLF